MKIKNTTWYNDYGIYGASSFNTHNSKTENLSYFEWQDKRYGMFCTSPEDFGHVIATLEKLCGVYKNCEYEKQVDKLITIARNHDKRLKKLRQ